MKCTSFHESRSSGPPAPHAGIPVTHRGLAAQVIVVTGHEDPTKPGSDLDWESLARAPGTLVRRARGTIAVGLAP